MTSPLPDIPPALFWVPLFAESLNRALIGDVYGWDIQRTHDPLRIVLLVRLRRRVSHPEVPFVRELLRGWSEANNVTYQRMEFRGTDFRAMLILRGLGPRSEKEPW